MQVLDPKNHLLGFIPKQMVSAYFRMSQPTFRDRQMLIEPNRAVRREFYPCHLAAYQICFELLENKTFCERLKTGVGHEIMKIFESHTLADLEGQMLIFDIRSAKVHLVSTRFHGMEVLPDGRYIDIGNVLHEIRAALSTFGCPVHTTYEDFAKQISEHSKEQALARMGQRRSQPAA